MAHENIIGSVSGATIKGRVVYNNAGTMTQRGAVFDFVEFSTTGVYTASEVSGQTASDTVVGYNSTNLNDPIGIGEYKPSVTVDNITEIQSGLATEAKQDAGDIVTNSINTKIGTPADIDSGGATISDNLKKIADDNGGGDFDATTDSLEKIRDKVDSLSSGSGTPRLE